MPFPVQHRLGLACLSPVAATAAALVLVGWQLDVGPLKSLLPDGVAMNPAAAATSFLAGVGLWLVRPGAGPWARWAGRTCGGFVLTVGLAVVAKYVVGWDHALDTTLFRDRLGGNRMAPNAAAFFALVGLAVALVDLPGRRGHWPAQAAALLALTLCVLVLVGYSFGARRLYGVGGHIPLAFNAALIYTALAVSALFARPARGVPAGLAGDGVAPVLARRLVLPVLVVPWVVGWLRLAGERAGLYDTESGVALMTVAVMALSAGVTGLAVGSLARADAERRRAEAAVRESAGEVRDLYENAPCGYHSVGADGTVVAMNRTELGWLGYAPDEVIGRKRFADFVVPGSRDAYRAAFARLKEAGVVTGVELELARRDGSTFPILISSTALRGPDGGYRMSRSALTDLTERKRAEAAVRLFADVVRNLPIGLLVYQLDRAGDPPALRVRSANPVASDVLGFRLDDTPGRRIEDVFPAIPDALVRRYAAVATSGRADDLGEVRYGDGRVAERWWAVQAFPLPDRCVGVAFQDVSARREAEDLARRLNDELERRVRDRTADLAEANRDLRQKHDENEMFVYSVSHDLRSPLVNLQGFSKELDKACRGLAELLGRDGVPADVRDAAGAILGGKVATSVGFIQAAVTRLGGIIDALLRLSRAGRVEYRWEAVDVARVVAQVVGAAQGTVAAKGATVQVGELPPAWGDRTAVGQVFANLVGNALTYLDPGRPGRVEVACQPADGPSGLHTYFVRDNGIGVASEYHAKIFRLFQRAHPGVAAGEGLGLAIVARAAERHKGRVWVESEPGVGSTFFVTLPAPPDGPGGRAE